MTTIKLKIGADLSEFVGEYWGPEGLIAILGYDDFPSGRIAYIKRGVVVHMGSIERGPGDIPDTNTFDGVVLNSNDVDKEKAQELGGETVKRYFS